jgi:hypothetical protein
MAILGSSVTICVHSSLTKHYEQKLCSSSNNRNNSKLYFLSWFLLVIFQDRLQAGNWIRVEHFSLCAKEYNTMKYIEYLPLNNSSLMLQWPLYWPRSLLWFSRPRVAFKTNIVRQGKTIWSISRRNSPGRDHCSRTVTETNRELGDGLHLYLGDLVRISTFVRRKRNNISLSVQQGCSKNHNRKVNPFAVYNKDRIICYTTQKLSASKYNIR